MQTYYHVFVRTWWTLNPAWPGGKEPCPGKKRYIKRHVTLEDALELCKQYNTTEAARAEFAATRPGGVEYVDETHSRGDVFRLFCLAFRPRAGQHEFVRATEVTP